MIKEKIMNLEETLSMQELEAGGSGSGRHAEGVPAGKAHDCQTNSSRVFKEKGYPVVIGKLQRKGSKHGGYNHAWNITPDGKIYDSTLGTEEAKKYNYKAKKTLDKTTSRSGVKIDRAFYSSTIPPHPFDGVKTSTGKGIGNCKECGKAWKYKAHWRIAAEVEAGGPGSGRHPYGRMEKPQTTISKKGKEVSVVRQTAAKSNAIVAGRSMQQQAEKMESVVASVVKGKSFKDSEPVDVVVKGKNGKLQGIEVKTILGKQSAARLANGQAEQIYQGHGAAGRKLKWARQNKGQLHTVVVDMRNGNLTVYHAAKVGSLTFGKSNSPLQPVPGNFKGLRKLIVG